MIAPSTEGPDSRQPESVVSFRVPEHRKHLMRAAAAERDLFLSEWLRRATDRELQRQMDGSEVE